MAEQQGSSLWHAVATLRPRLAAHARVHRHYYRGQVWYVVQDEVRGRSFRFNPVAHHLIALMDGTRSVQQVFDAARAELGEECPSQDDLIRLLSQLHGAELLQGSGTPDFEALARRSRQRRRAELRRRLVTPLAIKLPLLDPERLLQRGLPLVRWLFSPLGALLWLALVATGAVLAGMHWSELTRNVVDRVLAPQNLLLLWLTYPLVKALHELGHGFATKAWGGEVHEMGVMFLVFFPVPYVDASAASAFPEKWRRVVVGSAGIMVEVALAVVALLVWLAVEPGLVSSTAYNVMLIAGVSTLLFNGNPLLRYDGYYVFSDLIEVPNLGMRGNAYLGYLAQRHLLGMHDVPEPETARGERFWLVAYGLASTPYRIFILLAIALFVAQQYMVVGAILAGWAVLSGILWPLAKGVAFLAASSRLRRGRRRALAGAGLAAAALAVLVFALPLPLYTQAEGVVWVPEGGLVRAETPGFVKRLAAKPGSSVAPGELLLELEEPSLAARLQALEARLDGLEVQYTVAYREDRVRAEILREQIASAEAELRDARERSERLRVRSGAAGVLVIPAADDLPQRFLRQGERVGYVVRPGEATVRVIVPQEAVELVRGSTRAVEVRLAERLETVLPATLKREVPAATEELPSIALGVPGGGKVAVDPRETRTGKAFERMFQFDLALASQGGSPHLGGRAYVRFDHGYEPLAWRWYRSLRRLFLSRFAL